MNRSHQLPEDFLLGSLPAITKQTIDFKKTELPEYKDYYACILDNVLSAHEWGELIRAAKAQTDGEWQLAMINSSSDRQVVDLESRSCGRIIWDDPEMVSRIWARCQGLVPELHELEDKTSITGDGPLKKAGPID